MKSPAVNLLAFLQNSNVVQIRDQREFDRFVARVKGAGFGELLPHVGDDFRAICQFYQKARLPGARDWDGKTLYAECQIGKESIGIYPCTAQATVGWYGVEPMSVDDIDGTI